MSVNQVSASVNLQEAAGNAARLSPNAGNGSDGLSFKSLLNQGLQAAQPTPSGNPVAASQNISQSSNQNAAQSSNKTSNKPPAGNQSADNNQNNVDNTGSAASSAASQPSSNSSNSKVAGNGDGSADSSSAADSKNDLKKTAADAADPNANAQLLAMLGVNLQAAQPPAPAASDKDAASTAGDTIKTDALSATADASAAAAGSSNKTADPALALAVSAGKPDDAKAALPAADSKLNSKADPLSLQDDKNSKSADDGKAATASQLAGLSGKAEALKAASAELADAANAARQAAKGENFKQVLEAASNNSAATPASNQQAAAQAIIGAATSMQQLQNPAAVELNQLAPRVGTTGWDKAVGQKVVWMVGEGLQSAELTLNPPDLGPLHVVLKVTNDQASATFTAAQPEVREALESALPRLRQMMGDAGIQLSGFSVGTQNPGQQSAQQGFQQSARSDSRASVGSTDNISISSAPILTRNAPKIGEVDTFA